jgi:hypothetical protein
MQLRYAERKKTMNLPDAIKSGETPSSKHPVLLLNEA